MDQIPIAVPSRGPACWPEPYRPSWTAPCSSRWSSMVSSRRPRSATCLSRPQHRAARSGLPYASDPCQQAPGAPCRSLANVKASETLSALVGANAASRKSCAHGGAVQRRRVQGRGDPWPVLDLLASWADGQSVRELAGFQPDLAVAGARSTAVTGSPARACASRPVRPVPTISAWRRRCPPCRASSRRSALASCRRGWRKARNC